MQDFQGAHHEHHESVREVEDTHFELAHRDLAIVDHERGRRDDAHCHEQKDSAPAPTDERMHVYHIQQLLRIVLVVLKYPNRYLVGSSHDQREVTVVVDEQHEDSNQPLVCQVAEHDQED